MFFEPVIFGAACEPFVTAVTHLFIPLRDFLRDLNPIHLFFISQVEQKLVLLLSPDFLVGLVARSQEVLNGQCYLLRVLGVRICCLRD